MMLGAVLSGQYWPMREDDDHWWTGAWNSFQFAPDIAHSDLLQLTAFADQLGYKLMTREIGYSLEEVQARLREEGPGYFLRRVRLQEDISPKAPQPTTTDFVAERLARLQPTSELIITDPFLFTYSVRDEILPYAELVGGVIAPLLADGANLVAIVDTHQTHAGVQEAVIAELTAARPGLQVRVVKASNFHDRFWIADRSRGVIMGSSFNKIGNKVFFIDTLSAGDVSAVVRELEAVLAPEL
jgi:hypothetical protein